MKEISVLEMGETRSEQSSAPRPHGKRAVPRFDDNDRPVFVQHQVRELLKTAVSEIANGTKTSLLAGSSGVYHDLVEISFSNSSDASSVVELYDESTLVKTVRIPAAGTTQLRFPAAYPQNATGVGWYVDMEDITGTTVDVEALFAEVV